MASHDRDGSVYRVCVGQARWGNIAEGKEDYTRVKGRLGNGEGIHAYHADANRSVRIQSAFLSLHYTTCKIQRRPAVANRIA